MNKFSYSIFCSLLLTACITVPKPANIEDATVFHWDNPNVTMEKFIYDHKSCLGVKYTQPKSRMQSLLNPMSPYTVPKWDGMWATFESRSHREVGQRIAFSVPSNTSVGLTGPYRTCMLELGYTLAPKR